LLRDGHNSVEIWWDLAAADPALDHWWDLAGEEDSAAIPNSKVPLLEGDRALENWCDLVGEDTVGEADPTIDRDSTQDPTKDWWDLAGDVSEGDLPQEKWWDLAGDQLPGNSS
jgi:hypothetical protein